MVGACVRRKDTTIHNEIGSEDKIMGQGLICQEKLKSVQ